MVLIYAGKEKSKNRVQGGGDLIYVVYILVQTMLEEDWIVLY
jgi:hypothetical protein